MGCHLTLTLARPGDGSLHARSAKAPNRLRLAILLEGCVAYLRNSVGSTRWESAGASRGAEAVRWQQGSPHPVLRAVPLSRLDFQPVQQGAVHNRQAQGARATG